MYQQFIMVTFFSLCLTSLSWSANHHPQEFLKQISGSNDEGMQIVDHFCASCHAQKPIIPLGAPRIMIKDDWTARLKKGLDALYANTAEGLNAMPARGGCFECSDRQLLLAIFAMIPESERKALEKSTEDHK